MFTISKINLLNMDISKFLNIIYVKIQIKFYSHFLIYNLIQNHKTTKFYYNLKLKSI